METIVLLAALLQPEASKLHSPESELKIVLRDLQNIDATTQPFIRYMTAYAVDPKPFKAKFVKLDQYGRVIKQQDENGNLIPVTETQEINAQELTSLTASFCINSLSRKGNIAIPDAVEGTDNRIIRINLLLYGIEPADWDSFAYTEPYFKHLRGTEPALIVRTDWFIANAMYDPNYSKLLYSGIKTPTNEQEVFDTFGFNIQDSKKYEKDRGTVVDGFASIVSYNKRRLQRYQDTLGYLYRTNDFLDNDDKVVTRTINGRKQQVVLLRNPSENLLTPPPGSIAIFDPDASELIWKLPNGLQGYALLNKQRAVVPDADVRIVRDTKNLQNDPRVVNAASCIWCHGNGLNFPGNDNLATLGPDQINELTSYDAETVIFIKRFYNSDFKRWLIEDQTSYIDAVASCNGLLATDNADHFLEIVQRYKFTFVDRVQAAHELGCTLEELKHVAAKVSFSKDLRDLFAAQNIVMSRANFENRYQSIVLLLNTQKQRDK